MHIVHYFPAMVEEDGGVVRAILDGVTALADAGQSVTLLTHDALDCPPEWKEADSNENGPRVVQLGSLLPGSKRMRAADLRTLSRHLQDSDVVHLHTPWVPSNHQVGGLCQRMATPYVITLHGMLDDWCIEQKRWKKKLYLALGGRRLLEEAAFVHCTAQEEQRQSSQHAPGARWKVVPCLVDLPAYANLPGPELAREHFPELASVGINLLFLSRLHVKKGIERLLEAVASLRNSNPNLKLWIAGPGE
ncbi:MAG: glycosyltransferase, partial [Lacipirellulaceae bacterium]